MRNAGLGSWPERRLRISPDRDAIWAMVRERLAGYKVPRHIAFADELPKTATGKIRKPVLRDLYATTEENST